MLSSLVRGKSAVFIDASNIYHAQKRLHWRVDFLKLKKYLAAETDLWRIFFYTAHDPTQEKQKKFLDFLDINGFTVRAKKIKFVRDRDSGTGFHKGNLDVDLAIDAVHYRDQFDSFLLFSGDGDFASLIRYLKSYQKRCLIFSGKKQVAIELLQEAKFIDLKKLKLIIAQ
jgi:uncharacterized LabA/DUF88 family protein